MPGPRAVVVPHPCPECRADETWVTFRRPATVTMFCPACQYAWVEDVGGKPVLQAVPLTVRVIR